MTTIIKTCFYSLLLATAFYAPHVHAMAGLADAGTSGSPIRDFFEVCIALFIGLMMLLSMDPLTGGLVLLMILIVIGLPLTLIIGGIVQYRKNRRQD